MAYKKKLIEVALPLEAISREAAREKSIRHGHPSTLHKWWARRPLAAARAVLWASLVDDPSAHPNRFPSEEYQATERQRLFNILTELVKWENSNNPDVLEAAREEIVKSCDGDLPSILDPFCGGGTIPLEAQRLGLPAYGGDLNPVAVLISKATVEIPPRFARQPSVNPETQQRMQVGSWEGARGLAEDIRYYGQWMRDRAYERIGHLYPEVQLSPKQGDGKATVIAWIWARTVKSPDPSWNGHVPLVKSWVLRNRPKKPVIWIEPIINHDIQTIDYQIRAGGTPTTGTISGGKGICIATGTTISDEYIKEHGITNRMDKHLIAIVAKQLRNRLYLDPQHPIPAIVRPLSPASLRLSNHPQYMGTPRYGLITSDDLFTDRQLVALSTFSELLPEVRSLVEQHAKAFGMPTDNVSLRDGGTGATAYAEAVTTYLAFVIDKCADRWSAICSWDSSKESMRSTFARQDIPMVWDYAETNPFSFSMGNWMAMVNWVWKVVERLPASNEARVVQRDAQARVQDILKPIVSTDPPYYANVPYADISDFFYVWLRRNLKEIWPDELSTVSTPKMEELVADMKRHGSKEIAERFFETGISDTFKEVARLHHSEFPTTMFYAFKQRETRKGETVSTGWETFLAGLISAGLEVKATWPMRTELPNRPRSIKSGALASSIVIACRLRQKDAPLATRGEYLAALRTELPAALRLLREQSIAPVDMAQSVIGPGMAVFSRYTRVLEADGTTMSVRQALTMINEVVEETLSEEETEFDSDTRWALTWYQQHGIEAGPYGDAETLSKAKNTSVNGVVQAGIATAIAGKVQLVARGDINPDWDPKSDLRFTVWEVTQHLIARLEQSESEASDLLRQVGVGIGERARQLAYLLYQIADHQRWAAEAVAYNTLVTAWSTLTDLASREAPEQQTLLRE